MNRIQTETNASRRIVVTHEGGRVHLGVPPDAVDTVLCTVAVAAVVGADGTRAALRRLALAIARGDTDDRDAALSELRAVLPTVSVAMSPRRCRELITLLLAHAGPAEDAQRRQARGAAAKRGQA